MAAEQNKVDWNLVFRYSAVAVAGAGIGYLLCGAGEAQRGSADLIRSVRGAPADDGPTDGELLEMSDSELREAAESGD